MSRKSRSRPKSKSASRKRSNSQTVKTRVDEVAQKCKKLVNHKFEVTKVLKTVMSKLRMRSTSKGKVNLLKPRNLQLYSCDNGIFLVSTTLDL